MVSTPPEGRLSLTSSMDVTALVMTQISKGSLTAMPWVWGLSQRSRGFEYCVYLIIITSLESQMGRIVFDTWGGGGGRGDR